MTASPWLTTYEAALYAKKHPENIAAAAREWVRTGGKKGLRGTQPRKNAHWTFHVEDVDRLVLGLPPVRTPRKASA